MWVGDTGFSRAASFCTKREFTERQTRPFQAVIIKTGNHQGRLQHRFYDPGISSWSVDGSSVCWRLEDVSECAGESEELSFQQRADKPSGLSSLCKSPYSASSASPSRDEVGDSALHLRDKTRSRGGELTGSTGGDPSPASETRGDGGVILTGECGTSHPSSC